MIQPVIRAATAEDASFIAWAILMANRSHLERGWFDIALDRPEAECLEFIRRLARARTVSWWHFSLFLIAEVDGKPASALCRFRTEDGYPQSEPAMREAVEASGWDRSELGKIWQRGSYVVNCIPPGGENRWTLENVATVPEHRGHGLAGLLIARALDDGRAKGLKE